jgi:hypothetical protein
MVHQLTITNYSEKFFSVVGNTHPYKDDLQKLKGIHMKNSPKWIFALKERPHVERFINTINTRNLNKDINISKYPNPIKKIRPNIDTYYTTSKKTPTHEYRDLIDKLKTKHDNNIQKIDNGCDTNKIRNEIEKEIGNIHKKILPLQQQTNNTKSFYSEKIILFLMLIFIILLIIY